jgi:four helix bundle protein
VKCFEDLLCWQRGRELSRFVYRLTRQSAFSRDRGLTDQIQRAVVSVTSNIAEGFDRGTRESLVNFLFIAKGSCGEVRSQLYVAADEQYITPAQLREGLERTNDVSRLIQSFVEKVKAGGRSGVQFKAPPRRDEMKEFLREEMTPEQFKQRYPEG